MVGVVVLLVLLMCVDLKLPMCHNLANTSVKSLVGYAMEMWLSFLLITLCLSYFMHHF